MYHKIDSHVGPGSGGTVPIRCPHCRREGSFHRHEQVADLTWAEIVVREGKQGLMAGFLAGMRICPNSECSGLVFIARGPTGNEVYPPEVIDFDATALPPDILASLEEAVRCHAAGAYRATALMVRRVLEELCADRKSTGTDLKKRLQNLGSNVVVPTELLDVADELRLLGNDAAHIEAKSYDAIGEEEASLAVELAKELLKAVYQYQSLVDRLRGLRKP